MFRDLTYIFVFDSLNGKHPGAMKNLSHYLRFEATDKKGIENPSFPEGIAALVRANPNQWAYVPLITLSGSHSRQLLRLWPLSAAFRGGLHGGSCEVIPYDPRKPGVTASPLPLSRSPSLDEAEDPKGRARCRLEEGTCRDLQRKPHTENP